MDCKPPAHYCNCRYMVVASHIVDHIYKSGHARLRGHWFDQTTCTELKCERCWDCDVLKLGCSNYNSYAEPPAGGGFSGIKSRPVLCIKCKTKSKHIHTNWVPFIHNHALLWWVLPPPPESHPIHSIADLRQQVPPNFWAQDAEKVLLRYQSGPDYCANLMPLLNMEAKASSAEKLKMRQEVFLRHEWQDDNRLELTFDLTKKGRANVGDTVVLTRGETAVHCKITFADSVSIGLLCERKHKSDIDLECLLAEQSTWTVDFEWNPTADCRKSAALEKFAFARDSTDLRDIILGCEPPTTDPEQRSPFYPPEPFRLSSNQQEAVRFALDQRVSLIHGPPGTGKTQTLIALVYSLIRSGEQVLVCAPSKIATDHLFNALNPIIGEGVWRLRDGMIKNNQGQIESLKETVDMPREAFRPEGTTQKHVLCCTCIGSGIKFDRIWGKDRFDIVIIDEAAQATEPETLIPIVRGCKKLALFGDECQLGPVVCDNEARQSGLAYSMFRRLLRLKFPDFLLKEQYRINSHIWEVTSKSLYHGRVHSLVDQADEINTCPGFPWPQPGHPIMFWSCHGTEQKEPGGSIRNITEAKRVLQVIRRFVSVQVAEERIGVITFYEAQRREINERLRQSGLRMQAQNVDSFQGQENDFIILSCVRSNDEGDVGFLDFRRVNVALTRVKLGLVLIGNDETLGKCEFRYNRERQQSGDRMAAYKQGNPWVELLKGLSPYTRDNDWAI